MTRFWMAVAAVACAPPATEAPAPGSAATQIGAEGTCAGQEGWAMMPSEAVPIDSAVILQVSDGQCNEFHDPELGDIEVRTPDGALVPGTVEIFPLPGHWPVKVFTPDAELEPDTAYTVDLAGPSGYSWPVLNTSYDGYFDGLRTGSERAKSPGSVEIRPAAGYEAGRYLFQIRVDVDEPSLLRVHEGRCDEPSVDLLQMSYIETSGEWNTGFGELLPSDSCVCAVVSSLAGVDGEVSTSCP